MSLATVVVGDDERPGGVDVYLVDVSTGKPIGYWPGLTLADARSHAETLAAFGVGDVRWYDWRKGGDGAPRPG